MQVMYPPVGLFSAGMSPVSAPLSTHRSATDEVKENREQDRLEANRLIPLTHMAFDVGLGSNSITVTLSDRVSGEIVRRLVYDRGAVLHPQGPASGGHMLDVYV